MTRIANFVDVAITVGERSDRQDSAMKRVLEWALWLLHFPFVGIISLFEGLSNDNRDDTVYKDNVRKLIERNRRFEEDKG